MLTYFSLKINKNKRHKYATIRIRTIVKNSQFFVLRRILLPGVNALALTFLRTADNKKTEIELIGNWPPLTEPGNKYQQWIIRLLNCWLYMLIRTLKLSTSIIIFGLSAKVMTLNNTRRPLCIIQFKWIYLSRAWWSSFCKVFFCRLIILQIWITSGINWTEACDASNDFAIKQLLHKKIKTTPRMQTFAS